MYGKVTITGIFYHLDYMNFLTFTDNFTTYLERNIPENADIILLGDFNIHINILENLKTNIFGDYLNYFGLKIHILSLTYHFMNMLNLVIMDEVPTISLLQTSKNYFRSQSHSLQHFTSAT